MTEFASNMNYPFFPPNGEVFALSHEDSQPKPNDPPPPPPIVICPTEVDNINITLEKNQQCACKDCGKLFNSVWYLKQHAVKHSNDRPFKCKFCFKTYKFRSNLYQHKCPDRQKSMGQGRRRGAGALLASSVRRMETNQLIKSRIEANMTAEELAAYQCGSTSDNEDNDVPITYGLVLQRLEDVVYAPTQTEILSESDTSSYAPVSAPVTEVEKPRPFDGKDTQLPQQDIENFLTKNKTKLHSCRKCRLLFPTEEALLRHSTAHNREELFPYKCTNCRQAFECERSLRRHSQVHTIIGPWRCDHCCGMFRSSLALRRHFDQCRQCFIPPLQNEIMVSVHSPFDPFSFIPLDTDSVYAASPDNQKADSGVGSDGSEGSPHSTRDHSHHRSLLAMEDPFDMYPKKKEKEDDEDSGFRSRVNSVTQTCSPGSSSAFSCDGGSPRRKLSALEQDPSSAAFTLGGYGTGPTYGQQLFHVFPQTEEANLNYDQTTGESALMDDRRLDLLLASR